MIDFLVFIPKHSDYICQSITKSGGGKSNLMTEVNVVLTAMNELKPVLPEISSGVWQNEL